MNLQAIIVTNGIGCAILIMLLVSSKLVRQRKNSADKLFTAIILLTAEACVTETLTFILDGKQFSGAKTTDLALNSLLYLTNIITSFLWLEYTDLRLYRKEERIKRSLPWRIVLVVIGLIGLIANLKYEFIFSIDENMVYHREPAGYAYYVITFIYLAASVILRRRYYSEYGKIKFFPMFIFLVPVIIGAAVQCMFYGVSLVWCSVAIGLMGIYMSLQNELSYIDALTGLYNRNYLNMILSDVYRRNIPSSGIMIDLDYFKSINDTYGHNTGDVALIEAASIIRSAAPEHSITVRYAGDEFIVLIRGGGKQQAEQTIEKIYRGAGIFNRTGGHKYELSFSTGIGVYNGNDETTEAFLHRMDQDMYEEKKAKHERREAEERAMMARIAGNQ